MPPKKQPNSTRSLHVECPTLHRLDKTQWETFCRAYEFYASDSHSMGLEVKPLSMCIFSTLRNSLLLQCPKETQVVIDDEEDGDGMVAEEDEESYSDRLKAYIDRLFYSTTIPSSKINLSKIRMRKADTPQGVYDPAATAQYVTDFNEQIEKQAACNSSVPKKDQKQHFLEGLWPTYLRTSVEITAKREADAQGVSVSNDWMYYARCAIAESRRLAEIIKEFSSATIECPNTCQALTTAAKQHVATSKETSTASRQNGNTTRSSSDNAKTQPAKSHESKTKDTSTFCEGCGRAGHLRDACQKKSHPEFNRDGKWPSGKQPLRGFDSGTARRTGAKIARTALTPLLSSNIKHTVNPSKDDIIQCHILVGDQSIPSSTCLDSGCQVSVLQQRTVTHNPCLQPLVSPLASPICLNTAGGPVSATQFINLKLRVPLRHQPTVVLHLFCLVADIDTKEDILVCRSSAIDAGIMFVAEGYPPGTHIPSTVDDLTVDSDPAPSGTDIAPPAPTGTQQPTPPALNQPTQQLESTDSTTASVILNLDNFDNGPPTHGTTADYHLNRIGLAPLDASLVNTCLDSPRELITPDYDTSVAVLRSIVDSATPITPPAETSAQRVNAALMDTLTRDINRSLDRHPGLFTGLTKTPADVPALDLQQRPGTQLPPPCRYPRPLSPEEKEAVAAQLDKWRQLNIIQRVPNHKVVTACPIVVVRQNGKLRICIDFRKINDILEWSCRYPLPFVQRIIKTLTGMLWFGNIDLVSGYLQFPLSVRARQFTCFLSHLGYFQFTRIPFGIHIAPHFFQAIMDNILADIKTVSAYLDDIPHGATSPEGYLNVLNDILSALDKHNIKLNREKLQLGKTSMRVLGHIIDRDGISVDPARIQACLSHKPTNVTELRSVVGQLNYIHNWVPGISVHLHTLLQMLPSDRNSAKKNSKFPITWSPAAEAAWSSVTQALAKVHKVVLPSDNKTLVLRTDASNHGIGAVLFQIDGSATSIVPHCHNPSDVIGYFSQTLTGSQLKWSVFQKEAFAMFRAMHHFDWALSHVHFFLQTDNKNCTFLFNSSIPCVQTWALRTQHFSFTVSHIDGEKNDIADFLSRRGHKWSVLRTAASTKDFPDLLHAISLCHNCSVGHLGVEPTMQRLEHQFPNRWRRHILLPAVKDFLNACPTCQKLRRSGFGSVMASYKFTNSWACLEGWALDFIGPLPTDTKGNCFILVCIDMFSRFTELFAVPAANSMEAAAALVSITGRYGAPKYIQTDHGTHFTAAVISELLSLLGTTHKGTIAHHPASNGMVERLAGEVGRHLRAIVFDLRVRDNWSLLLPLVQRISNYTVHSAIGTYPARLIFGDALAPWRQTVLQPPTKTSASGNSKTSIEEYIAKLTTGQQAITAASIKHQEHVIKQNQKRFNRSATGTTQLKRGDLVLSVPTGRSRAHRDKLSPYWQGPFTIVDIQEGHNTVMVQDLLGNEPFQLHRDMIKYYDDSTTDSPLNVALTDIQHWVVDHIVSHRKTENAPTRSNKPQHCEFQVRWKGCSAAEDSWLPWSEVRQLSVLNSYLSTSFNREGGVSRSA